MPPVTRDLMPPASREAPLGPPVLAPLTVQSRGGGPAMVVSPPTPQAPLQVVLGVVMCLSYPPPPPVRRVGADPLPRPQPHPQRGLGPTESKETYPRSRHQGGGLSRGIHTTPTVLHSVSPCFLNSFRLSEISLLPEFLLFPQFSQPPDSPCAQACTFATCSWTDGHISTCPKVQVLAKCGQETCGWGDK